jgi:CBS domain-containing protein
MKVGDIMNREPVTARTTQTFGDAFRILVENRTTNLPVIDEDGVFKGNFDLNDIWRTLLPRATQLARKSIEDLAFVSSSIEKLKERIHEAGPLPVTQFLTAEDAPTLFPENPLTQAILLLDEHEEVLAVVDRQSRKLVGTLSSWDVLDPLRT